MSEDLRFRLSDLMVERLARKFGTPLYVLDEASIRARIRQHFAALSACWPKVRLSYASKANGTLAVLAIARQEGCWIDCASEGELRAALAADVPPERCCLHGNDKSAAELLFALDSGVGEVVADNFEELAMLATWFPHPQAPTSVLLRLAPAVDPQTHDKIATGRAVTKFGFSIADGSAERALLYCLERQIPVHGFHCHVGSQVLDAAGLVDGAVAIARFAVEMKRRHGFVADLLDVGGGRGVRYVDEDPPGLEEFDRLLALAIKNALQGELTPTLAQEPGRAIVAEAGVTLYTVGVVKEMAGTRFIVVDGGLADNPRPALYGARYEVLHTSGTPSPQPPPPPRTSQGEGEVKTVVAGRHCETDTLFEDVNLPADVQAGDRIQVLSTGAYASSMASNYNRYPRPATVLMREDGRIEQVQLRETYEEMLARERLPEDLCG